ncbi:hypothetical protein [Saccharolobus shibatae]|uniref:Uncharacterized protein n=1 Tax=Saccharolobus shibatae TaxID=2286 RepID=A0A8F5GW91_9CREN|nr:hypothetical protein [Saccharolobus shibatae]QXJ31933.1 hypothetical protein J5U21_01584 [Saccharolobus shibatae]
MFCCNFLSDEKINEVINKTENFLKENLGVSPLNINVKKLKVMSDLGMCRKDKNVIYLNETKGLTPITVIHEVLHCHQHSAWDGQKIVEGLVEFLASYIVSMLFPNLSRCLFKDRRAFCFVNSIYPYLYSFWATLFVYLCHLELELSEDAMKSCINKLFDILLKNEIDSRISQIVSTAKDRLNKGNDMVIKAYMSELKPLFLVYKEIFNGEINPFDIDELKMLISFLDK